MRSMTGFAGETRCTQRYDIFMSLKSVNSRYFEFKLKSTLFIADMEIEIKNKLFEKIKRGKIDLFLRIIEKNAENYNVVVNYDLAKLYETALTELSKKIGVVTSVSMKDFISIDGILNLERVGKDKELEENIMETLSVLIEKILEMMEAEGKKTVEDIDNSLNIMDSSVEIIEKRYPEMLEKYKNNLKERIDEFVKKGYDDNRLLMEVDLVASRTAVNEEIVRLKSHINQFKKILSGKIKGDSKKLDFIGQEMHRESNTIASKSSDYDILEKTIVLKGEIEKIREQLRNLA